MGLLTLGQARCIAVGNGVKLLALLSMGPLGYYHWGIQGLLGAMVVSDAAKYLLLAWTAQRRRLPVFAGDMLMTAWLALTTITALATAAGLIWVGMPPLWSPVMQAAVVGAMWVGPVWRVTRQIWPARGVEPTGA